MQSSNERCEYRSILVPLDGSEFAEHALPTALSLARRHGAALHIARVYVPVAGVYGEHAVRYDEMLDRELMKRGARLSRWRRHTPCGSCRPSVELDLAGG